VTGLRARAKLTWTLEITGRRGDGLHTLRAEMTTIHQEDILVIDVDADYVHVFNPFPTPVPSGAENIVARALALVGRRAGVQIEKGIPVGGGLGGGSADAAAILRWAGGVAPEVAVTLGSDVPFCQVGGRCLVEGVGEVLTPLAFEARDVTLMMPDFGVDTAACYRAYDEMWNDGWRPTGLNHLEEPAGRVEPRLADTLARLRTVVGDDVGLAGSGSTLFVGRHVRDAGAFHWDDEGPHGRVQFLQTGTTPH